MVEGGAGNPEFWRFRWQTGQTGWDHGGPHRLLPDLLAEAKAHGLPRGAEILEPGCGRAHNGATMARLDYHVISFDAAPEAIYEAKKCYADVSNLKLVIGDALTPNSAWRGAFDAVFDRAMLCALPPEKRRAYVDTCFAHLKPGGLFMSLPFMEVSYADGKGPPPFQMSMSELASLFSPGFSLLSARDAIGPDPNDKIRRELVAVWKRRPRQLVES